MKLLKPQCHIGQVGETDFDNVYGVEQEMILDEGSHLFAGTQVDLDGKQRFYVSEKSVCNPTTVEDDLHVYFTKKCASKHWPEVDFDALDKRIKKLIEEYYHSLDDTALQGGIRGGARLSKEGLINYAEGVSYISKQNKYLYLQIIRNKGKNHYSVTDTSMYMRIHLGPMYDSYFDNKKDITYLFEGDNLDELGNLSYLKEDFLDLDKELEKHLVYPKQCVTN